MSSNDLKKGIIPTVEAFMELGFKQYESQILAILTALGTSTVKDIHKYTDVPLPKVYQTLESLERDNFIKQHSKTRPAQFTAYSPDIIIRRIQEDHRDREEKLRVGLNNLSELTAPTFVGEISPFTGINALHRIVRGLLLNVKKELSVAMSAKTLSLFQDEINDLKERGVYLRSLAFSQLSLVAPSMKPELYKDLGFDHYQVDVPISMKPNLRFFNIVKQIGNIIDFLGIMISDNGEVAILLPLFPHETYFGIWIHSKIIINRQLAAYNELFKIAKKA
ncbi:MAG: TrmB family transcriptional regulator [Asgard group archaeon]|nr:TrmB family transcriptional regulator [Asgard group archaeon]